MAEPTRELVAPLLACIMMLSRTWDDWSSKAAAVFAAAMALQEMDGAWAHNVWSAMQLICTCEKCENVLLGWQ
jgi:hypothetical protein